MNALSLTSSSVHAHIVLIHNTATSTGSGNPLEENVRVEWSDHVSEFNASWLRGEDVAQLPTELTEPFPKQSWDAKFNLPQHDYAEGCHDANCEAWTKDLCRYGALLINGVPPNYAGLRGILQTFGPIRQRFHPTNVFTLRVGFTDGEELDKEAYGLGPLAMHIDGSEYVVPSRVETFLCQEYSAPEGDTVSVITDGLRAAKEFSEENPEEYKLLSTIPLRYGRFRLTTEENCPEEDVRTYHRHSVISSPLIVTDNEGQPEMLRVRHSKHVGLSLSDADQETSLAFYKAYNLFRKKLDDPAKQARFILCPGTALLFDNYRICHGRDSIFPSTTRSMIGAYVSNEVYQSRYRLVLSQHSRLEPRWLFGCSTATIEALAQRFLPQ